jgi:hypothetical protein
MFSGFGLLEALIHLNVKVVLAGESVTAWGASVVALDRGGKVVRWNATNRSLFWFESSMGAAELAAAIEIAFGVQSFWSAGVGLAGRPSVVWDYASQGHCWENDVICELTDQRWSEGSVDPFLPHHTSYLNMPEAWMGDLKRTGVSLF